MKLSHRLVAIGVTVASMGLLAVLTFVPQLIFGGSDNNATSMMQLYGGTIGAHASNPHRAAPARAYVLGTVPDSDACHAVKRYALTYMHGGLKFVGDPRIPTCYVDDAQHSRVYIDLVQSRDDFVLGSAKNEFCGMVKQFGAPKPTYCPTQSNVNNLGSDYCGTAPHIAAASVPTLSTPIANAGVMYYCNAPVDTFDGSTGQTLTFLQGGAFGYGYTNVPAGVHNPALGGDIQLLGLQAEQIVSPN